MTKDDKVNELPDLVVAAQAGVLAACDELVLRYNGHVFATALGIVQDAQLAEDLTQEAFVQAFDKIDKLRNPELFAAWMRRVTRNLCLDYLRHETRKSKIDCEDLDNTRIMELESPGSTPAQTVEKWELTRVLLRGISRLPAKYRKPLVACYFEGRSYRSIAAELCLPIGSVKTLIFTGKEKLREVLVQLRDKDALPTEGPASPKLVILSDKNRGQVIDLDARSYVVGRHPRCGICFDDATVSGRHCRLRRLPGGCYEVEDLGSTNGTWLNSQQVDKAILKNSDVLQVGCLEIVFDRNDAPLTSALATQTGIQLSLAVLQRLEDGDLPPGRGTASLGRVVISGGRPQFVPAGSAVIGNQ